MANVQEVLDTQKSIEETLSSRMAEFEKQFKIASVEDNKHSLDNLAQEFKSYKEMVWSIFQMLRSLIQSLKLQVDDLDSYNRRNALLFSGIEEKNNEDCKALLLEIIRSTMNFSDMQASSILSCHRLGTKNSSHSRPILVRFVNVSTRNEVWNEKKRLKSSPAVLSEFLTKPRQAIFSTARKHFGITRCWTRDGKILVLLPNNDRRHVSTMDELALLMAEFPPKSVPKKTSDHRPRSGSGSGPAPAAASVPPQTRRATAMKNRVVK